MVSTMVSMFIEAAENMNVMDSSNTKDQLSDSQSREEEEVQQEKQLEEEEEEEGEDPQQQQQVVIEFDKEILHEDFENEEGHVIELGENDDVSSLGSGYSVGDSSGEDIDASERRQKKDVQRRKQLRNLGDSARFNKSRREQPRRRTRIPSRTNRSASPTAHRGSGMIGPPQRQRTNSPVQRPLEKTLQRNQSTPELLSPRDKPVSQTTAPARDSLTKEQRVSSRSLNYLELWNSDDEDTVEEDMEDEDHDNQRKQQRHLQRSNASNFTNDSADDSADNSRWSASTGTNNRSLNSTQMEQLSTIPRFPRRQRTGEGITKLRHRNSQDTNDTNSTPKRRPQLPNRQKSFRRGGVSMGQAAQAALAKASGTPPHSSNNSINRSYSTPEQSRENSPPSKPRRSISGESTLENSWGRQKSLPNLMNTAGFVPDMDGSLQRADSTPRLHVPPLHQSPRLPERKPSDMKRDSDAQQTKTNIIARLLLSSEDGEDSDSDDAFLVGINMRATTAYSPRLPERKPSDLQRPSDAQSTHTNIIQKRASEDTRVSEEGSILGGDSGVTTSSGRRSPNAHPPSSPKKDPLDQDSKHMPRLPRRQDSNDETSGNNNGLKVQIHSKINPAVERSLDNHETSDSDDDDDDDSFGRCRSRSQLPPHLRSDSPCLDESAKLPMRQMSVTEAPKEDEDGDNDFFAVNAKYLGVDSNDDTASGEEDEEEDLLVSKILVQQKGGCKHDAVKRNEKFIE